jgi:hypothetical protein
VRRRQQRVEHADLSFAIDERVDDVGTDEPGSAGDEDDPFVAHQCV